MARAAGEPVAPVGTARRAVACLDIAVAGRGAERLTELCCKLQFQTLRPRLAKVSNSPYNGDTGSTPVVAVPFQNSVRPDDADSPGLCLAAGYLCGFSASAPGLACGTGGRDNLHLYK